MRYETYKNPQTISQIQSFALERVIILLKRYRFFLSTVTCSTLHLQKLSYYKLFCLLSLVFLRLNTVKGQ